MGEPAMIDRRTFVRRIAALVGTALAAGALAATTPAPFVGPALAQPGRGPRILLAPDFDEIRSRMAAQPWARDAFAALKRTADGLVTSLPPVPDQGGGWFHAGGEAYEITRVHNRLAEGARTLGLVYRLTDDPT